MMTSQSYSLRTCNVLFCT